MSRIETYIIDSRSYRPSEQTVFVAIASASGNGHDYVEELYNKGVRDFIVSEHRELFKTLESTGAHFQYVKDTRDELRCRAMKELALSRLKTIAIVGSRGKSIVKEWLSYLLYPNVEKSPRSYNSQIGVPLSILNRKCSRSIIDDSQIDKNDILQQDEQCIILEAGISQSGEMQKHECLIRPEIVILTNVTEEHSESFSSRSEQIKEKLLIAINSKKLVIPGDDRDIIHEALTIQSTFNGLLEIIAVSPTMDRHCTIKTIINGKTVNVETIELNDNKNLNFIITDKYSYRNLCSCIGGLKALGKTKNEIEAILENEKFSLRELSTRLNVLECMNNNKIIVDNFTFDLPSFRQTLDFVHRTSSDKSPIVVIVNNSSFFSDTERNFIYSNEFQKLSNDFDISKVILLDSTPRQGTCFTLSPNTIIVETLSELFEKFDIKDYRDTSVIIVSPLSDSITSLLQSHYEAKLHESTLEINLDSLLHNYKFFKSLLKPTTRLICMLKAFGYGTGYIELSKILDSEGVGALAVAVPDEGIELRRHGIHSPIMILNPHSINYENIFDNLLEPVIYNFTLLDEIGQCAKRLELCEYPIHIKLETGMRRLGFIESEIEHLSNLLTKYSPYLRISSVFSHLATADCPTLDDYTTSQIVKFRSMADKVERLCGYRVNRHILNSAGIIRFPEAQMDMVRLGIGLYGIKTLSKGEDQLRPVASLYSTIISLKHWKKGDTVGYGCRGVLARDSIIATIPIGYADGIDRRLGNGNGYMFVRGVKCQTVGNICMDLCMIDVSDVKDCKLGERVEIFGNHIDINEIADSLGTIPYEILTSISHRIRRRYFRE